MARPVLFIFARAPAYGAVKTRLARDIGAQEAFRFYRNALDAVVRRFRRDPRIDVILAVTPATRLDAGPWPRGIPRIDQGRGDLGQRMLSTLKRAGRRPALLIGSDIPEAGLAHVREALSLLTRAPFVLAPTEDGGYWMIGTRRPWLINPRQLAGVRWSTAHALSDTQARLCGSLLLSQTLSDVDDGASWSKLKSRKDSGQTLEV